ncbi:MAG: hypothetical protein JOZ62_06400 [Acidobacteriaceae bacterium]|nr:hypothetical protein [Acidobacteriaceae bacterium]
MMPCRMRRGSRVALLALGVTFFSYANARAQSAWQAVGPNGGDIPAIAIDPTNSGTLYAESRRGGMFTSTDGAGTWSRIGRPFTTQVTTLSHPFVIDPATPSTLYTGTSGFNSTAGYLFKSEDSGKTWTRRDSGLPSSGAVYALAIDPQTPTTLYAGLTDGGGLFKSTDGALSWQRMDAGITSGKWILSLAFDPVDSQIVYAGIGDGTGNPGGLFRSSDGGQNWAMIGPALAGFTVDVIAVDPQDGTTMYAGVRTFSSFRVYKSTDGGGNWTQVLTDNTSLSDLALDPTDHATVYVSFLGRVWKSHDGGSTWQITFNQPNTNQLAVDPNAPATVYAATATSIFQSTDQGTTWAEVNAGLNASSVTSVVLDPQQPATVFADAPNTHIYKSVDGGASWNAADSGLFSFLIGNVLTIDPINTANLYVTTSASGVNAVYKTSDAGASWQASGTGFSGATVTSVAVNPAASDILYASSYNNNQAAAYRSADGGQTWADAGSAGLPSFTFLGFITVDPTVPTTLYGGLAGGGFFKSVDEGATWTQTPGGFTGINTIVTNAATPGVLYAGTGFNTSASAGLYKSTDSGDTLAITGLTGRPIDAVGVSVSRPNIVYAGGRIVPGVSNNLYKSYDGGRRWVPMGFGDLGVQSIAVDPTDSRVVYVGTDSGAVYKTTTGGCAAFHGFVLCPIPIDWR